MDHKCIRCNYETNNRSLFVKHLQRKTICKPINGNISLENVKTQYITVSDNTNINPFGSENISYICNKFIIKCMKNGYDGLIDYLRLRHFDPKHPENHNIVDDGEFLTILSVKEYLQPHYIFKMEPYKDTDYVWVSYKKKQAISHYIISSIEIVFVEFINNNKLDKKLIKDFVESIICPLNWTSKMEDYLETELTYTGEDQEDMFIEKISKFIETI